MGKFLKPGKAVIILNGRFAGRKALIIRSFEEGTRDRPYGQCLVSGIVKNPRKLIQEDSDEKAGKKSKVKVFINVVNYTHIMPTRFSLDVDLKETVAPDDLQSRDKKISACKESKGRNEERFKRGKDGLFFTKLRF